MEYTKEITIENTNDLIDLFGPFDENIKIIERTLNVSIIARQTQIKIIGEQEQVEKTYLVIEKLLELLKGKQVITKQIVTYVLEKSFGESNEDIVDLDSDTICITPKGKEIKVKTVGQRKYVDAINKNTVTFAIGPAGTGKTYLAVAIAVSMLRNKFVDKIVLTRPAVEAGESLGYLPGDLQEKIDPYLRPLYDALYEMLGDQNCQKYMERGIIEIAPLAYMRGRTLNDSFIILDEAQNTTPQQMKMFLTRIGFNTKVVVTGDVTQVDLPTNKTSGLREVSKILKNVPDLEFMYLDTSDVVRNQLVQKIIKAYEKYESENE